MNPQGNSKSRSELGPDLNVVDGRTRLWDGLADGSHGLEVSLQRLLEVPSSLIFGVTHCCATKNIG